MNIKKITLSVLEKELCDLGYFFIADKSATGYYCFFKNENGFDVGLIISRSKWSTSILPLIKNSLTNGATGLFKATEGIDAAAKDHSFNYSNDDELKQCLNIILNQFKEKGDRWIRENCLQIFDLNTVYEEFVDDFLYKYSFVRVITENALSGGKIVYKKGDYTIRFQHASEYAHVGCIIGNKENEKSIYDILLKQFYLTGSTNDPQSYPENRINPYFSNKEEYIESIRKYLRYLENDYFPKRKSIFIQS